MTEPDWEKIELENRGLTIRTARVLGEGWTSRAYLVNNELVFRFPKRAEDWQELEREIEFLSHAGSKLSLSVPGYLHVAPESSAAACGYAMYRYLRGESLDVSALTARNRAAAADVLATFLQSLHTLQSSDRLSFLPSEDPRLLGEGYLAHAEQQIVPSLGLSDAKALREQFKDYLSTPASMVFQPTVLHADLSGEHILAQDGSIVGIIDFGDVCWGDPDYDFMYLYVDFGPEFVGEVARRYGHPDLNQLRKKLDYFAVVDQISTIVEGTGRALNGQEEEAWRRLIKVLRRSNGGGLS